MSIHAHGGAALRMDAQMRAEKARQLGKKGKERCGAREKGTSKAAYAEMRGWNDGEKHHERMRAEDMKSSARWRSKARKATSHDKTHDKIARACMTNHAARDPQ